MQCNIVRVNNFRCFSAIRCELLRVQHSPRLVPLSRDGQERRAKTRLDRIWLAMRATELSGAQDPICAGLCAWVTFSRDPSQTASFANAQPLIRSFHEQLLCQTREEGQTRYKCLRYNRSVRASVPKVWNLLHAVQLETSSVSTSQSLCKPHTTTKVLICIGYGVLNRPMVSVDTI